MSNLDGIDVFVKVIQCGSFTSAAKLLQMPVTTVSGKIKQLEARLGLTLIHRTTRKLSITEAGSVYFHHCLKAMEEVIAAEQVLVTKQSEPEGLLRITAAPNVGHTILPPIIKQYLQKYPKTKVELILTGRFVDLIGESIDIAIRAGILKDSTLVARKLLESDAQLWASTSYTKKYGIPKNPSDLSNHHLISFKPFGDSLRITNGQRSLVVKMNSRLISDDFEAVKIFVAAGEGIGFLPPFMCSRDEAGQDLVSILPEWILDLGSKKRGQLSIVYPPQRYVPPKVQAFIDLALKLSRIEN